MSQDNDRVGAVSLWVQKGGIVLGWLSVTVATMATILP